MALSLEYVAGLFDGEGWCRVQTPGMNTEGVQTSGALKRDFPSYQIVAGIAMTHKPMMRLIHDQFGGTLHGDNHYRRKDPKNRTIYRWHCSSKKAEAFFTAILPFLVIKKDQVELALKLQDHITANNPKMRHSSMKFRARIAVHRKKIADRITILKKVNFDLPVDSGAKPYRFLSSKC
jgi:hypothetical protein